MGSTSSYFISLIIYLFFFGCRFTVPIAADPPVVVVVVSSYCFGTSGFFGGLFFFWSLHTLWMMRWGAGDLK